MADKKPIVVYDNRCLLCIHTKNQVDKFDKNKKLKWVGIDSFNYKKYKLKKEDLFEEMYLIDNGKIYKGYYSWKQITKRIPLLLPLYIISFIPGVDFIGDKVYRFISRYRYKFK